MYDLVICISRLLLGSYLNSIDKIFYVKQIEKRIISYPSAIAWIKYFPGVNTRQYSPSSKKSVKSVKLFCWMSKNCNGATPEIEKLSESNENRSLNY